MGKRSVKEKGKKKESFVVRVHSHSRMAHG